MRTAVAVTVVGLAALLGEARTSATSGAEPVRLPGGGELAEVDFDRHVAPLFGRLGCNTGACHGSFQGRGGLSLSLFGHDAARDYLALTRDAKGRRLDPLDPGRSLVLLKATARIPHEGGRRLPADSWEYRVLLAWIAEGARRDEAAPAAESIEVRPGVVAFAKAGESAGLSVVARFADGSEADVTPFCDLRIRDEAVAEASDGRVRGLRPGETALVASYRGILTSARVSVPTGRPVELPEQPGSGLVDREVDARLRALGIAPSNPSSDAEFLRRVTLDTIGSLPSPERVRAFLDDPSPHKRSKTIDALLTHPWHAALWATRYLDITGCDVDAMESPEDLRPRRAAMWHAWFRKRFAENMPYDQIARGVLCATSRDAKDVEAWLRDEAGRLQAAAGAGRATDYASKPGLDLFWRRFTNNEYFPVEEMAERTAVVLMGVRLECAQCHKHPFDRWTQSDYRSYANIFAKVRFGHSPAGLAATARLLDERRKSDPSGALPAIPRLQEVYVGAVPTRRLADATTKGPLPPKAPGGPAFAESGDPREALFAWLTRPDNPYFAPSFVNRVWAAYFGAGLVDPVDGLSVANPPTNARLLDALSADFVASGFDVRRLERLILESRAYQRSSVPAGDGVEALGSFASASPRLLSAEVLLDVLNDALGVPGDFGPDAPAGSRAIEVASNRVASEELARTFRILGRPRRVSICDCERSRPSDVPRTLFLMTDEVLLDKVRKGRAREVLASDRCDAEAVEELFLATLSRLPGPDELDAGLERLRRGPDRVEALVDLLWALINTREFVLNH